MESRNALVLQALGGAITGPLELPAELLGDDPEILSTVAAIRTARENGNGERLSLPDLLPYGAHPSVLADAVELPVSIEQGRAALVALATQHRERHARALGRALHDAEDPEQIGKILDKLAELREAAEEDSGPVWATAASLANENPSEPQWVAPPYVARQAVTDLTAKVKAGKTRFALEMVRAVLLGESFLGRHTIQGPVVYLTEERPATFQDALGRSCLVNNPNLHILLRHSTRKLSWPAVVRTAVAKAKEVGAVLLVVDTLSDWAGLAGEEENNAGAALAAVRPLHQAAAEGLAVLMLRHDRKSGGELGDAGRGSSAFAGAADVLVNLTRANTEGHSTRRVLDAVGRFEVPPRQIVELDSSGRFVLLGDAVDVERREVRRILLDILPSPGQQAVTEAELRDLVGAKGSRSTVMRALGELQSEGLVIKERGLGKTGRAWGYQLSGNASVQVGPRSLDPEQLIVKEESNASVQGYGAEQLIKSLSSNGVFRGTPLGEQSIVKEKPTSLELLRKRLNELNESRSGKNSRTEKEEVEV